MELIKILLSPSYTIYGEETIKGIWDISKIEAKTNDFIASYKGLADSSLIYFFNNPIDYSNCSVITNSEGVNSIK